MLQTSLLIGLLSLVQVPASPPNTEPEVVTQDRIRIRTHLLEVERDLRARDVSHLSDELREERQRNIDRLALYRFVGEFPHNTYVPGLRPVFIDADGRACAVGHLVIESGHEDVARAISQRENLAYLPDMQSPEVALWLATSGLTAAEAARIQPTYRGRFCGEECPCNYTQPVCGSDGVTYYSACAAEACDVFQYNLGCCEAEPAVVVQDEKGNNDLCMQLEHHCPTDVAKPGPPWDVDPPTDKENEEDVADESGGCATASEAALGWPLLLALLFARRRR